MMDKDRPLENWEIDQLELDARRQRRAAKTLLTRLGMRWVLWHQLRLLRRGYSRSRAFTHMQLQASLLVGAVLSCLFTLGVVSLVLQFASASSMASVITGIYFTIGLLFVGGWIATLVELAYRRRRGKAKPVPAVSFTWATGDLAGRASLQPFINEFIELSRDDYPAITLDAHNVEQDGNTVLMFGLHGDEKQISALAQAWQRRIN